MVWRRILVPTGFSLRQLHGVIQVAMGWEGIHLYQFHLRAVRYGSLELAAASPDVTLTDLKLRPRTRFAYEYNLNIPWAHELRIEDVMEPRAGTNYAVCSDGSGNCPPEDCNGPAECVRLRGGIRAEGALHDFHTLLAFFSEITGSGGFDICDDVQAMTDMKQAVARCQQREHAEGQAFSRRRVNTLLKNGAHRDFMHQVMY